MQTASSCSSVKEEFLKKWIKGLQKYDTCKREMSITERKNAIKLSADVAMASTITTRQWPPAIWRRSVMAGVKHAAAAVEIKKSRPRRCLMKRIHRRPLMGGKRAPSNSKVAKYKAAAAAARWKKRSAVLKGLIPGGECMEDDNTLIKETLDYILALRLQIDVMRHIASASASSSSSS